MSRSGAGPDVRERSGRVVSRDGTPIAWSRYGAGEPAGAPLLLVHGTTADHTTFRVIGPRLAERHLVIALDRRGRGKSGDRPPYSIEREYEDVASVAAAMARATGQPVDVLGHSYGGRCALGAGLLEPAIRRVVSYEGAVPAGIGMGERDMAERLEALDAAGRPEVLLRVFLTEVVQMTPTEWEAFRTSPVWPARVAAAHTVAREVRAGAGADPAWERYAALAIPVLQVLGSESAPFFRTGADALDARLGRGRIAVIQGARHNAHHTHVDELLAIVEAFLAEPDDPPDPPGALGAASGGAG